ncbi:MAG: T9SS C-terminal target domain-containing protein, partial [Cytophagales bacterium]
NLSSVTPTLSGVTFTTTSSVASVTWDAVNGATNYDVDVATSSDFSLIYQTGTSITGTSFDINKPRFKEFARTEAATVVYFRIKAKNSSSSSNFSNSRMVSFEELTSLSSVEKASSLNILYPNPSKGLISVKSASSISKSDILILNTLGDSVSFEYNLGTISISTKGLYFVSIRGKTTTLIVE